MTATLLTPSHLLILLVVGLLLFGAKKLPETGRSLGSGIREFKDALIGGRREDATAGGDQDDVERPRELVP
jgi:sec-independent protein translocase protein TatA